MKPVLGILEDHSAHRNLGKGRGWLTVADGMVSGILVPPLVRWVMRLCGSVYRVDDAPALLLPRLGSWAVRLLCAGVIYSDLT